jgi:tetratricopeptide (TPR) repeat protein
MRRREGVKRYIVFLGCIVLAMSVASAAATNKYTGSPAARAEFDKGTAAKQANDWEKAIAEYKKAIELDPNFAEAHMQYLNAYLVGAAYRAMKSGDAQKNGKEHGHDAFNDIIKQYEELVRQHPQMPVYRWVLAMTQVYQDPALKEENCRKTIEIDPSFGPGYGCLASVAELRGDTKTAAEYLRKALATDPEDKGLWSELQNAVTQDPVELKATTTKIVEKFPTDELAAQALYTYADTLPQSEQIAKFQEIIAQYPPNKFHFTLIPAGVLLSIYDRTDPANAALLTHKISADVPDDKGWKANAAYEDSMAAADNKVAAGDGVGALSILKDVKPSPFVSESRLQLLKAKAENASGNTQTAYSELLKVFASEPSPEMQPALYEYGSKLGKTNKNVDDEVWNLRSSNAKPAIPFTLDSFVDGKKVSLDDFKGKIVLLDFWYPSCGPCMRAMPYLQDLYSKYKNSGLVFIGINGMEGESNFVMPLVKSRGWGFIPLKGNQKWDSDVYHVEGYPSTFLIGADGKAYFQPHTYDQEQHDIADMEIQALLAAAKQGSAQ